MDILLDIDAVLRNFLVGVYKTLKKYYPTKIPDKQPIVTEWDFTKFYPQIKKEEIYKIIFDKKVEEVYLHNAEPIQWMIDAIKDIRKLLDKNNYIFLRTHQPEKAIIPTIQFVQKYKIDNDGIFFSNIDVPKNKISNSILIDDKPENIIHHGLDKSIIMNRPWNQSFNRERYRISNKDELLKSIKNIFYEKEFNHARRL